MTYLDDVQGEQYSLEVHECPCGFHIGLDTTYLEQVGSIEIQCPACEETMKAGEFK